MVDVPRRYRKHLLLEFTRTSCNGSDLAFCWKLHTAKCNYNTGGKLSYVMLLRQVSTQSVTAREVLATLSAANEKADVNVNVAPERIPAIFLTTQSLV